MSGPLVPLRNQFPQRVGQGDSPVAPDFALFGEERRLGGLNPIAEWKKREVGRSPDTLGEQAMALLGVFRRLASEPDPSYHVCRDFCSGGKSDHDSVKDASTRACGIVVPRPT